jgi:hypothetical protein
MPDENPGTNARPRAAPTSNAAQAELAIGGAESVTPNNNAESGEPPTVAEESKPTPSTDRGKTMEIHAPEKPIHSKKEFMFHMFTVVLGILIALALDGMVTWAHHRILVREARANIATELRNNKEIIEKAVPEILAREKQLQGMISTIDEVEKGRKLPTAHVGYTFASYEIYSTAWKTAAVSGAVTHMEYDQLKAYTDAYDLQQDFLTVQAQGFASVGDLAAAMHLFEQDLRKVPQSRLEEAQRQAVKILTIQKTLENVSAGLILAYDNALK